jgi:hypothetical protein
MLGTRLGAVDGGAGEPLNAVPSGVLRIPDGIDALENATSGARRTVSGSSVNSPAERGVWFMLRRGRRVGALVVNAPPEESALARWSAEALAPRLAGRDGRPTATSAAWAGAAFAVGNRRSALTPLLLIALLLIAAEAVAVRTSRSSAA